MKLALSETRKTSFVAMLPIFWVLKIKVTIRLLFSTRKQVSVTRKCHKHKPQTNLLHQEEEKQNRDGHNTVNPLGNGNSQKDTMANSDDPDEIHHYAAYHHGLHCLLIATKSIIRERNTIVFGNYNLLPLNIYNGPSGLDCIKLYGKFH